MNCFNACDGTATANISGGTPGYTMAWSPGNPSGQGTTAVSALCTGNYSIVVVDANSCLATASITINQPTALTAALSPVPPTCNGGCNGSIGVTPGGGTGPYTYTLMPGGITTAPPFSGLCAGSYTVLIGDANNCVITRTVSLTQPSLVNISLNATTISCFNQCNASITSTVSGGTPGYTYSWAPGGQTSASLVNQCAGDYTLTATDANSCVVTATVTVINPPDITSNVNGTNPSCFGLCDGTATAIVSGGTPGYTYSWTPGGASTSTVGSLCAGSYTMTVTDSRGCIKTNTLSLTAPPALTLTVGSGQVSCEGSCDATVSATVSGGTPGYTYTWSPVSWRWTRHSYCYRFVCGFAHRYNCRCECLSGNCHLLGNSTATGIEQFQLYQP